MYAHVPQSSCCVRVGGALGIGPPLPTRSRRAARERTGGGSALLPPGRRRTMHRAPTCRNRHFACAWGGSSALDPLSWPIRANGKVNTEIEPETLRDTGAPTQIGDRHLTSESHPCRHASIIFGSDSQPVATSSIELHHSIGPARKLHYRIGRNQLNAGRRKALVGDGRPQLATCEMAACSH